MPTCPHCGNRNPALIQDNGERSTSPDLTLLCVKPCLPGQSSFLDDSTICGCQWEPNAVREAR